jgi:hypothetical protein
MSLDPNNPRHAIELAVLEQRRANLLVTLATMTDTECDFLDGFKLRSDARLAQGGEKPVHWRPRYSRAERDRAAAALIARGVFQLPAYAAEIVELIAETLGMAPAE